MKRTERLQAVMEGKLPMEELTNQELRYLEQLIFRAVKRKLTVRLAPSTSTRQ